MLFLNDAFTSIQHTVKWDRMSERRKKGLKPLLSPSNLISIFPVKVCLNWCWRACNTVCKMTPLIESPLKKTRIRDGCAHCKTNDDPVFESHVWNPRGFKSPSLPPQQLQVLLNSLFKVLCNFPSRYLFAIELSLEYLALDGIYHQY